MDIFTVRDNLVNTIKGKEILLASWQNNDRVEVKMMSQMLDLNIDELKKILTDVTACCDKATADAYRFG